MRRRVVLVLIIVVIWGVIGVIPAAATGQQEGGDKTAVKLVYWTHWVDNNPKFCEWYALGAKEFSKANPKVNLEVEVVPINYQSYVAKYLSAFQAGKDAPDFYNGNTHQWAGQYDYAAPMPKDVAARIEKNLIPYQRGVGVWKNVRYGRPLEGGNFIFMYYNVDMFKEAGLDPDKPPKTYDEVLEYAKKLTKKEGDRIVREGFTVRHNGSKVGIADKFLPRLHAYDAVYYKASEKKASGYINSKNSIEAFQAVADLIFKYKVTTTDIESNNSALGTKTAAISCGDESWAVGWLQNNAPTINFRVAPQPKQYKEPGAGTNFPWADMVYKNADPKKKEWAWKFIDFISQPEQEYAQHVYSGVMTTYAVNMDKDVFKNRPDYEASKIMISRPPGVQSEYYYCEKHQELFQVAADAITNVMFGRKTAEAACNEAAQKMDDIFKQ